VKLEYNLILENLWILLMVVLGRSTHQRRRENDKKFASVLMCKINKSSEMRYV
jgi:hypothetical protein